MTQMGNIRERGIKQQAAGGENGTFFIWIPSNRKLLSQLRKSFYVHNRIEVPLVPVPRARGASSHLASCSVSGAVLVTVAAQRLLQVREPHYSTVGCGIALWVGRTWVQLPHWKGVQSVIEGR